MDRLHLALKEMLALYREVLVKVKVSLVQCKKSTSLVMSGLQTGLQKYSNYLAKFIDQLDRRILQGETIPHSEKMFSIFEPEVEWLQKGKQNNKVELGHNVLVTTDQYHFILDYKVMLGEKDVKQPLSLMSRLQENYNTGYKFESISFDRGFHSRLSKIGLKKGFETVVLPKKGKQSEQEKEETKVQRLLLNRHSAVESNINELERSGVNKVPDKGLKNFLKYVGVGVLAYNIKRLGGVILQNKKHKRRTKQ